MDLSPFALSFALTVMASIKLPSVVIFFLAIKSNMFCALVPAPPLLLVCSFNLATISFIALVWFSLDWAFISGAIYLNTASLEFIASLPILIIAIGIWPSGNLPSDHNLSNNALFFWYVLTAPSYCAWDLEISTPAQAASLFLPLLLKPKPPSTSIELPLESFTVPEVNISDIPVTIGIPS